MMSKQHELAMDDILDLVNDWQQDCRRGHCLPVLSGSLLEWLEALADERRRDNCSMCNSTGKQDGGDECPHCKALLGT